ncbi:MAG TPA: hypothetical protein DEE98_05815 [Elusimicrobia bacterium]|nr:MAG: hypothetical protein A2278_00860 [Elusimicrobia bacterium RIFOXYA12_FULL_49_49]OGS09856.1 MAG: hypothetical protein A2204_05285 [Elusimicrobia bacterium RIFOXYA1_FULL_47_7]OGS11839.1 MAG: hypothetical protein A2386_01035 [Elusimicrobia bacterium RIFOXYB1_FULL_48_9]OGS15061.1 MAG: hypothetical protein A2251_00180 [Elusimicrobia bacterium RIFOXYA2_FULL_47_53]OGS29399.1 MAG: hypothetical protein A2323_00465 [Elusimicrobia bacterium RIFOXYB2_FULL_46_23]HBU69884.1 hypothetical protein [Elus
MAVYQLKKVVLGSLVKSLPVVFVVVGALIGLFTFFIFPTEVARNLTIGARFLSWLIFVVLYAILMVAGVFVISFLYNWIAGVMGGVKAEIEEVQE